MMIANPETMRVESLVRSASVGRWGWLTGTALAGRIGALAVGAGAAVIGLPGTAAANPTDGHVVAGSAEIITVSPVQLDIVQSSNKAIINWGDFSIGAEETTNFLQPGRNSWTLNRVTGGNPSAILGALTANGNVIVLNQNGVLFGPNSRIDVGGLIASTANIGNDDFLADRFRFEGAPQGSTVINQGRITVAEGGLAALVAPGVANSGVIEARLGRVSLAAGTAFTVDLYGDGLVSLALGGEVTQGVAGPDGAQLAALVTNDGRIVADGGSVLLTAEAAMGVVDSVINMGGVIEARSVGEDATGAIVLRGGESGVVAVAGTLDASGAEAGLSGGRIEVTGELVHLQAGARLDASGMGGGGTVLVGGDFHGQGTTPTARRTLVEAGATLAADATAAGDGGRIVVWADEATAFYGHLTATGGALGGDGGFAEISGKEGLAFDGSVDLTAAAGAVGTVLFDPRKVTFMNGGMGALPANPFLFANMPNADFTFDADAINNINANTVVEANQNIVFNEDIVAGDAFSYTFQAGQGIDLGANITTSGGAVTLIANSLGTAPFTPDPTVTAVGITGNGNITTNGGAITLTVSTGLNTGAINLTGTLDSSNAPGNGGAITVTNLGGMGAANAITLGNIATTGGSGGTVTVTTVSGDIALGAIVTPGLLDINATTVRLEGDLVFGSLDFSSAPIKVQVGSIGTGALGGAGSIQDAIDIAAVDALIVLDAGGFNERGILLDKRVDITGAGKDPATGSVINADPMAPFALVGRGDSMAGITVTVGGVDAMNTALLEGFAVTGAARDGIVLDRGAGTIGFITLLNVASLMNGDDGLAIVNTGTAQDLLLDGVMLNMNGDDGLFIELGTVRRLTIDAGMIASNGSDGIFTVFATLSDIAIENGAIVNRNFGNGIHITGGTIAPEAMVMGSFGLLIDQSQIVSNRMNGILIDTVATVRDLTIRGSVIANNGTAAGALDGNGIFVRDSTLSDLVVDDSDIGTNGTVAGNDGDGIRAQNATLSEILVRDSVIDGNQGNGIHVIGGTIATDATVMIGLTIDPTTIVGNALNGILIEGGTIATDVTILDTIIASNGEDGIRIIDSTVSDLDISNTDIDSNDHGIRAFDATLSGILIRDSMIQNNAGSGIAVFNGTIATGTVTFVDAMMMPQTLMTGLALKNLVVVGQFGSGVFFDAVTATDVTIKDTDIAANMANGVFIGSSSTFTDFAIQNSHLGEVPDGMGGVLFAGNGSGVGSGDGFIGVDSTFTGVAFLDSFFNGNGDEGITFDRSRILSGDVSLHDPMMTLTTGFALKNSKVIGNSSDGVDFLTVIATDVTIKDSIIAENTANGVRVSNNSTFTDFAIQNSHLGAFDDGMGVTFAGNGEAGFFGFGSTFTGVAFLDSFFNANGFNGIVFSNSAISSGAVTPHAADTPIVTGFKLKNSQVVGNVNNGVEFDAVTATDVTIKGTIIAANTGAGVLVGNDSDFTDFAIQNSYLGAALNPLGGTFAGNGGEGFLGELSTFTGVAFLDSFFNGNGGGGENADGIGFGDSTILSGAVTPHAGDTPIMTGFKLKNSQVVGNLGGGVRFDGTTATDVTIKDTIIAANMANGVFIGNGSDFTDFAIQNSYLGAAPNPMGGGFTGNGADGFFGLDSIFTGVAFLDSFFNGNGANGIAFAGSAIQSGAVTPHDTDPPIMTGFALLNSDVVGNTGNGVAILASLNGDSVIDDVVFDGGTTVANNGPIGIEIVALSLTGTDGSVLFGNTTITDQMTGILVENMDAMAPLLLTFGATKINGGTDGLVLSGAGIALTGGGGVIPGGTPVGGGMMPGDGLFGGSLGKLSFNGQAGEFITLASGALFDPGMPTVIDASNVTFNGVAANMLSDAQRQNVMNRIVDFNDDPAVGLIFPPGFSPGFSTIPSPAENPGLIDRLPGDENTPGDTLFRMTGGVEFNPDPGQPNAFCFGYPLAIIDDFSGKVPTCPIGPADGNNLTPAPVPPNESLGNFWRGWQAARL